MSIGDYAGVMLGDKRRDLCLRPSTYLAVVESFDPYPKVMSRIPAEFCGIAAPDAADDHIDVGGGWRVDIAIHDLIEANHGPLFWGKSKHLDTATNGVKCPLCWAWDRHRRLVAIVAPLMQVEQDDPLEATAEAQDEP